MTKDCCAAESLEQKSGTSLLLFEVYNQGIIAIDHIAYCPLVIFSIFLPKSLLLRTKASVMAVKINCSLEPLDHVNDYDSCALFQQVISIRGIFCEEGQCRYPGEKVQLYMLWKLIWSYQEIATSFFTVTQ
jgi:hypothetical protein